MRFFVMVCELALGLLLLGSVVGFQESFASMVSLPHEVDPDVIYFEKQLSKIQRDGISDDIILSHLGTVDRFDNKLNSIAIDQTVQTRIEIKNISKHTQDFALAIHTKHPNHEYYDYTKRSSIDWTYGQLKSGEIFIHTFTWIASSDSVDYTFAVSTDLINKDLITGLTLSYVPNQFVMDESLKKQLFYGLKSENIHCKSYHYVVVERPNEKIACVSEETAEKLGWKIVASENYYNVDVWHMGNGLKIGDYFEYSFCHIDYENCKELYMKFWIEEEIQTEREFWIDSKLHVENVTRWIAQTEVHDGNEKIQGEMNFNPSYPFLTEWSKDLSVYEDPFIQSVWCNGSCSNMVPTNLEVITIPAGTFDVKVHKWGSTQTINNIWVIDNVPFPLKGSVFLFGPVDNLEKHYEFTLLDYKENIFEYPFQKFIIK